jgi:TldD protein
MKTRISVISALSTVFVFSITLAFASAQDRAEVIFSAMQDEMKRSISELVMEQLEKPYFIAYTIHDLQELRVQGSLGMLVQSNLDRSRSLSIDLRVGDQSLDNTNFKSMFSSYGVNRDPMAIEDYYDSIRNTLYLATDSEYKQALKNLSKKRAYLQGSVDRDRPDDFIKQPANQFIGKEEAFDINSGYFEELARAASRVFRDYPMIHFSQLEIDITVENQYFMNSEGSKSVRGGRTYTLILSMSAKNKEGEDMSDGDRIIARELKDLPKEEELVNWARRHAETMKSLISGEELEEYVGPVVFTDDAAGEFFRQLFTKNISNLPSPIYENEQYGQMVPVPRFANRVKRRVLPAFIDIYDDPTVDHIGLSKLVGFFGVDDAGNTPKKVQLVKQGKLVNLLIGTAPTKKVKEPNGHARGAVGREVSAQPGNLFVESADSLSYERLVKSMLKLCKDFDSEYGLVIKKLSDPNAQQGRVYFGSGSDSASALSMPLEAYKVYPDGREVPVRNLEFSNVTVMILKDILKTDNRKYIYNYLIGNDTEMPASVMCPSVLIEEMELKKSEKKVTKPPVLPSPLAAQQSFKEGTGSFR